MQRAGIDRSSCALRPVGSPRLSPIPAGDIIRMPHTPINRSFSNPRVPAWFTALDRPARASWRGCSSQARPSSPPAPAPRATRKASPIEHETIRARCAACHLPDSEGRMSRISFERKTPEGWQGSLQRMISLNGVTLAPEEAREIVKYLADNQGLAPEELRPGLFEVEKRMIDHRYHGGHRRRIHLHPVPFDGAGDHAAAHARGVGAPYVDAPRLLPARGLPGLSAHGSHARPTRAGRGAARHAPADGARRRSPLRGLPPPHPRVGGVVGDHAPAPPGGHVGPLGSPAGPRRARTAR